VIEKMPMPSHKRALELGAAFIEQDLAQMRMDARKSDERGDDGRVWPVTHCLEHDFMKVAEWAAAAATLRALAKDES
jgi:hypothetical protein